MTALQPAPVTSGISFVDGLRDHGEALALIDADGTTTSYARLAERVDEAAEQLGSARRVVLVAGANRARALVWYLAALRGGHVALLAGAEHVDRIAAVHRPGVIIRAGADGVVDVETTGDGTVDLHPELSLLLSTSGSTGSPKLVRLSRTNVDANAAAIAQYLELEPTDRAITSLPMHYCYGLSVIHSHLAVGAAVVLTEASVIDPCFWDAARRHGVTNLAGVPHTFDLLDRVDLPSRRPSTLRFVTQAGGRMDPAAVRRYAELGAADGWDLVVMYGQTEATARMAYLPPAVAASRPEAAGIAVPGGSFRIDPVPGLPAGEGEIVYTGPNVMLGYAESPADLARGPELDELRTGDLGRIAADGLLEITGRRRDFLKLFGLRIDLEAVERRLRESGIDARCTGDDDGLAIAVLDDHPAEEVGALVRDATSLPARAVAAARVRELPRLSSGKLDRATLTALVRDRTPEPVTDRDDTVAALLAGVIGVDHAGPDDTFVSLGGDSLSYVEASVLLEERLGRLPDGWHVTPVSDLEEPRPADRGRMARIETGVALRAVAICLIVGNHAGLFLVGGGAHVLFAGAGFNFARFQLSNRRPWRSILRLAVPAVVWIGGVAALTEDFDLAHAVLLHGWVGGRGRWAYWFVEVLVQVLVLAAALLAVPAVRRLERRFRFGFPAALLAGALLVRFDVIDGGVHHRPFFRPHEIAWLFLLGWLVARADTVRRRLLVTAVTTAALPGFFDNPTREAVVAAGVLLLVWAPWIPVPRPGHRVVAAVAGASLYTYLTHVQVHPLVSGRSPIAGVLLSLAVGVAVWRLADPAVRRLTAQTPSPWRPAPSAKRAAPASVSPDRTGTRPRRVSLARASGSDIPHCS